ncbi:hypothetical protein PLICRDRAFT_43197 [Plicaturopsis crispa FD-325 SS-3]|nr:hypothetical protein PLICRDRAFT_43197 [Plicaturopsis crispa FD-325 SS-3]
MEDESTAKPMLAIRDLLVSPLASSILNTHPNHISTTEFMLPVPWLPWWDWAADLRADDAENPKWLELVRMYVNEEYESPYMDKVRHQ